MKNARLKKFVAVYVLILAMLVSWLSAGLLVYFLMYHQNWYGFTVCILLIPASIAVQAVILMDEVGED